MLPTSQDRSSHLRAGGTGLGLLLKSMSSLQSQPHSLSTHCSEAEAMVLEHSLGEQPWSWLSSNEIQHVLLGGHKQAQGVTKSRERQQHPNGTTGRFHAASGLTALQQPSPGGAQQGRLSPLSLSLQRSRKAPVLAFYLSWWQTHPSCGSLSSVGSAEVWK